MTFYANEGYFNCIVGLGKDTKVDRYSKGFLAYAKYNKNLESMIYSFEMVKATTDIVAKNRHNNVKKLRAEAAGEGRVGEKELLSACFHVAFSLPRSSLL